MFALCILNTEKARQVVYLCPFDSSLRSSLRALDSFEQTKRPCVSMTIGGLPRASEPLMANESSGDGRNLIPQLLIFLLRALAKRVSTAGRSSRPRFTRHRSAGSIPLPSKESFSPPPPLIRRA